MRGRQQLLRIRAAAVVLEAAAKPVGIRFQGVGLGADLTDALLAPAFPMNARGLVAHKRSSSGSVMRQRNEFGFPGYGRKLLPFPTLFGTLDALLGRGDEIPPDEPRRGERCAAEQHRSRTPMGGAQHDFRLRLEHREFALRHGDLADDEFTLHYVHPALAM